MIGVRYARIFWIGAAGVLVLAALISIVQLRPGELLALRKRSTG